MPKNDDKNRGGKRPNAGRKPRKAWEEVWWRGFRDGNSRLMAQADRMRDEARAAGTASGENHTRRASDFSSHCERSGHPVAGQDPPDYATAPPISADERNRRAKKQANYRARQRAGVAVLRVPVPFADVVTALIEAGRLSPAEALDRRRVEVAGGEVFAEWSRRWLQENR